MKNVDAEFEVAVDRTNFPPEGGEWDREPNKLNWTDESTGMACMIVRNGMGALCGYVAVTKEHPDYRKDYNEIDGEVRCHGGITYSDECSDHICHVPEPGQPDDVWWFGFDCAHLSDFIPGHFMRGLRSASGIYRNVAYVKDEVKSLAEQLYARRRIGDV